MRQPTDVELKHIGANIARGLAIMNLGKNLNGRCVERIFEFLAEVRSRYRQDGIDVPVMVPIILMSIGRVYVHRADLSRKAIETVVVNIHRLHEEVPMYEIARAVHACYPHYKPRGM